MLRYRNEKINDDKCQYHNQKYNFYCFECNNHLCELCVRTNNHITHNKIYINELQPIQEDLNKMKEIIKNYKNQIENLVQKLINKPKELKIILDNKTFELNQKMTEKITRNNLNEKEDLNLIKNRFLDEIDEIRKIYIQTIKIRKNQFKIDEFKIKKKYKLINDNEIIKYEYKIKELNKKYNIIIQNIKSKLDNINNLKKINELVYNTYFVYNDNYFNVKNLKNSLLSYQNHDINDNTNLNINELVFYNECKNCSIYPIVCKMYYCDQCNKYYCEECGKKKHPHPLIIINSKNQLELINQNMNDLMIYKDKIEQLRKKYDLKEINNIKLIEALKEANGNIDEAIIFLFQ